MLQVSASPSFDRVAKKLHARDKKVLDTAIKAVLENPQIGEEKKGDLARVFVYKFKLNSQETLLAYELLPSKSSATEVILLAVGPHENCVVKRTKMPYLRPTHVTFAENLL